MTEPQTAVAGGACGVALARELREAQELQDQLMRHAQELRDMKDYSERVTKELRRYQTARPSAPPARPEDDLPLPPWACNMQMMSPLLFAYEERIAELEAVVERSVSLAEHSQALTKENDTIRAELQERTEQLRNAQLMQPTADATESGAHEELQELYRLSVEQNEALAQQNQLLKVQLERMQHQFAVGSQQSEDCKRATAIHAERADALSRQRGAAEQRLEEVTGELVEEVRLREQLQHQAEGLKHDLQLHSQSLEATKKSYQDRCALATDEEERLKVDFGRASHNEKEQRRRIKALERDLAQASEQYFLARSEADATKGEAVHWLRDMDSMEKRLRDISERHDTAHTQLSQHEHQVSELSIERDKWEASEHAAKKHVERLQSRLDSELDKVRQEHEHEFEQQHSAHKRSAAEFEERLRRSEQSHSEFQSRAELVAKQRAWEAAALERQSQVHAAERSRLESDLEEVHQTRLKYQRLADEARRELVRKDAEVEDVTSKGREQATQASADLAVARQKFQAAERQLIQAREEIHAVQSRVATGETEYTRLRSELREVHDSHSEAFDAERRKSNLERQRGERHLQGIMMKSQQDEQRVAELLRSQEAIRQRWHQELAQERDDLEGQIERLGTENHALREKSRAVLRTFAASRRVGAADVDGGLSP